jgi:hypothetical protein
MISRVSSFMMTNSPEGRLGRIGFTKYCK